MTSEPRRLPSLTSSNTSCSTSRHMHPSNWGVNSNHHRHSESCCGVVGKVLCLRGIKRSSIIKVIWLWIITLSVIVGVTTTTIFFGPLTSTIAPTDMRIVDNKVSTMYCSSLSLSSEWTTFSAYLLNQKPTIVFNKLDHFEVHRNKHLQKGEYKYWAFYLLKGSEVTIKSCAQSVVDLYVIMGRKKLNQWMKKKSCDICFLEKQSIDQACSYDIVTFSFTVDVTDEYYFLYMNTFQDTWLTLKIILERTLYDTSDAKDSCIQSLACSFDLDIDSDEVVVYQISNDDEQFDFDDITIETKCNDRLWIYILLFLIIPFLMGITLCSLVYAICKDPTHSRLDRTYCNERSPLLWHHIRYPPHPVVPIQPPKYEDIVHIEDTSPPSYQEAVG